MIFQGAGNRYWKPNLNDPSQAVGASVSGIADWYGQPIGSFGAGNATGVGVGSVGSTGAVGSTGSTGVTGPGGNLNFSSIVGGGAGGGIAQITQLVNEIDQASQKSGRETQLPGQGALEQQNLSNIGDLFSGKVLPGIKYDLAQGAAERGAASGGPLGANNDAAYLRAIGRTAYDQLGLGSNLLSQAVGRNPAAPIYSAGNQVLTAAQVQDAILARENMANQLRMAQLRASSGGRGGGGGGIQSGGATPGISSSASNWANPIVTSPAPGWNFPPGYSSIPVGHTPGSGGDYWPSIYAQEDEDWNTLLDEWLPQIGSGTTDNQFDYNWNDVLEGYA